MKFGNIDTQQHLEGYPHEILEGNSAVYGGKNNENTHLSRHIANVIESKKAVQTMFALKDFTTCPHGCLCKLHTNAFTVP